MPQGIYKHKKRPDTAKRNKEIFTGKPSWNKGKIGWSKGTKAGFQKGHLSFLTEESIKKLGHKKEKHPNWKGGITSLSHQIRNHFKSRQWRSDIFARDNWTCQKYGIKGGKIHPHHIKNFAQFP
ncbi:MAG: hypothetical protein Q7I94_07120, partial [Candidatus Contubernalis sp.]|nr:hypothetical protein [Candidatus Contubernalis sp.]